MWAARSLGAVLAVLCLTGCSDSNISGGEVAKELRGERFAPRRVVGKDAEGVNKVFCCVHGPLRGVREVILASNPELLHSGPQVLREGPDLAKLTLAAFVFDSEQNASAACRQANVIGACLQENNVVFVVRNDREPAANRALDDLG